MVDPFGLSHWLAIAGFAGVLTLMVKAARVRSKLRSARLVTLALVGAVTLQSLGLIVGFFHDASWLQRELLRSNGQDLVVDHVIREINRLPVNALLVWFGGAVFGLGVTRLFQLFWNRATITALQEKLS